MHSTAEYDLGGTRAARAQEDKLLRVNPAKVSRTIGERISGTEEDNISFIGVLGYMTDFTATESKCMSIVVAVARRLLNRRLTS